MEAYNEHLINILNMLWGIIVRGYKLAEEFPEDDTIPITIRQYINLLNERIEAYQEFLIQNPRIGYKHSQ